VDPVTILVALTGAIPAIVAMWVVDRLDRRRPEPPSLRRLAAFLGMLSVIPALVIGVEISLDRELTYGGAAFQAYVVAAGVEEACKIGVIYWLVWRQPELDERMDGIVYASRAGLGFALVENVLFLMLVASSFEEQLTMWVLRATLAVPGHAMWTGMIGGWAARRRFDGRGPGILGGYLLAVAFHGTYDVALFLQQPLIQGGHDALAKLLLVTPLVLTIVAFFVIRAMARTALYLDDGDAARHAAAAAIRIAQVKSL
jgi:RsiW-degrading membrane proteinase PrsW (M82 family)